MKQLSLVNRQKRLKRLKFKRNLAKKVIIGIRIKSETLILYLNLIKIYYLELFLNNKY